MIGLPADALPTVLMPWLLRWQRAGSAEQLPPDCWPGRPAGQRCRPNPECQQADCAPSVTAATP